MSVLDSPLIRDLVEIGKGQKSIPESNAKRHHFIPQLALSRFAREDRLFQLDTRTGKPQRTSVRSAGSRHQYYRFPTEGGGSTTLVESYFSLVEGHAGPAIRRMIESGKLPIGDRATIAFYLSLLWARTPGARMASEDLTKQSQLMMFGTQHSDTLSFRNKYREFEEQTGTSEPLSEEDIEELRVRTIKGLQRGGDLQIVDPGGSNSMALLLKVALEVAGLFFEGTEWTLMRSSEGRFVTSDRGLSIYDPTPRFPWSAHAVASSPNSQTMIPMGSDSCLGLLPSREAGFQSRAVRLEEVRLVNLRTYGWADKYIYGSTQDAVVAVRKAAKRYPHLVKKPRPLQFVTLVESQEGDTRLADEHRRRGWPPYLKAPNQDGTPTKFDYMVLDEDGDPVEIGVKATQLAKSRAQNGD